MEHTLPAPIIARSPTTKSMRVVCVRCEHTEVVGHPPYDEEMLAAVRETCEGPCPSCGTVPYTDEAGRLVRILTTE